MTENIPNFKKDFLSLIWNFSLMDISKYHHEKKDQTKCFLLKWQSTNIFTAIKIKLKRRNKVDHYKIERLAYGKIPTIPMLLVSERVYIFNRELTVFMGSPAARQALF